MILRVSKLTCLILLVFTSFLSLAQNFPDKPTHLVNDYTGTLSEVQIATLEQKLISFDDSTSTQIAVVLIRSLEGYDVADYAVRLAQKWGIGRQKKNNGALLLVSIGDRKVTIQTGYGLEGALPDAIAKRIIESQIKPNFKQGNYYLGLEHGTDAIIAYTKGEYKNDKKGDRPNAGGRGVFFVILIIIVIVIISRISKGGGNGGSQVIGSRGEASPMWWILLGFLLNGNGRGGRNGGWGGGSSGGDFGGFGGGSFGGGGASGDW